MTTKFDISAAPGYNDFLDSVSHLQPNAEWKKAVDSLSIKEKQALVKIENRKAYLLSEATKRFIESLSDSQ
jgi:hypothetical protein